MPRISRQQHLYDYSIEEVQAIATKTGTTCGHINKIISGSKTKSEKIANEVSALTGKPPELYLVQKGVIIDPIPQICPSFPETYEISKVDEQTQLCDLSDLDLLQLMREVSILAAEIAIEIRSRIGGCHG